MQFALKTYYRAEFLPLIVAYVSEIARLLGASPKECSALGIASEEAGLHIIEHFPGGQDERFEVTCEDADGGLRVVFSNMGLPVNPQALPKYETDRPEETLDGLGLFLIERMVDHVEFVNRGREGWRTVLFKRLENPRKPAAPADASAAPAPGRDRLRTARAEDAHVPGIVELAYRNYGYSYSKELFYYADQLRAALADGSVQSFVALNPAGQVVGQMGILRSPHSRDVAEVGAVMVQPEYRRSMGLLQLIKTVIHHVRDLPDSPAILETNLVTTHTLSQRICASFDFKPMALKLSVHGRAKFRQLAEDPDGQRESLLHALSPTRPLPPVPLFVPPRHADITRRLFDNAGIPLQDPGAPPPLPPLSVVDTDRHPDSEFAAVSVRQPGADFAPVLRKTLFDLEADGVKTTWVRFPGWLPQPPSLESEARALRLFFCGWVVEAPDRWWLLHARLAAQRFDFNRIQLFDPFAVELRTYVETCFQEAVF